MRAAYGGKSEEDAERIVSNVFESPAHRITSTSTSVTTTANDNDDNADDDNIESPTRPAAYNSQHCQRTHMYICEYLYLCTRACNLVGAKLWWISVARPFVSGICSYTYMCMCVCVYAVRD